MRAIAKRTKPGLMLRENCVKSRLEILISKSVSGGGWAFCLNSLAG